MRFTIALVVAFLAGSGVPAGAKTPEPLLPLGFLLGEWEAGANTGPLGQGTGAYTFALSLQGKVIVRSNHAEYPPSAGDSIVHDDLMVIYATTSGTAEANYYDSEGHVIHYLVTVPAPGRAVFVSGVSEGAPRFRLTYDLGVAGILTGKFEVAPPGKPEEFAPFLAWESRKASSGGKENDGTRH